MLDATDAPPGFYAVLKDNAAPKDGSNICRACDWRPDCSGDQYRCMPYEIETPDGRTLKREDACSVVFKRHPLEPILNRSTTEQMSLFV